MVVLVLTLGTHQERDVNTFQPDTCTQPYEGTNMRDQLSIEDMSLLERCYVQASMELGPEDVPLLERCPHFRGWYVEASMELRSDDVSLLERCPYFRGWYVEASMELRSPY